MSALSTFEQVELQEKLEQSSKEIERLNALVAMQAEALKAVNNADIRWNHDVHIEKQVDLAISASSSTVAKWEAERDAKTITSFKRELSCIQEDASCLCTACWQHVEKLAGREINRLLAANKKEGE